MIPISNQFRMFTFTLYKCLLLSLNDLGFRSALSKMLMVAKKRRGQWIREKFDISFLLRILVENLGKS